MNVQVKIASAIAFTVFWSIYLAACSKDPCAVAIIKVEQCLGEKLQSLEENECSGELACKANCVADASCDEIVAYVHGWQSAIPSCTARCMASSSIPDQRVKKNDGGIPAADTLVQPRADSTVTQADAGGGQATTCNLSVVGKHCRTDPDCGAGAYCLGTYQDDASDSSSMGGVCTCDCTPDDPSTDLINEDSCGTRSDDYVCGKVVATGGTTLSICLKKCTPSFGMNSCDGRIACDPGAGGQVGIFDGTTVCLAAGCQADADCPLTLTERCKVDGSATCQTAGALCYSLTSGSNDGICAIPGTCDVASGLCTDHSDKPQTFKADAQVGDPCRGDTECAANQTCLAEFTAPGKARPSFRNGYCTIKGCAFAATLTAFRCPLGSHCNSIFSGGLCQKACNLDVAASCRGNAADKFGDYECRDYSGLTNAQNSVVAGPTCDWGENIDCNLAARIAGGQLAEPCALFGDILGGNPTRMRCRHIDTGADLVPTGIGYPDEGVCLDDTASNSAP